MRVNTNGHRRGADPGLGAVRSCLGCPAQRPAPPSRSRAVGLSGPDSHSSKDAANNEMHRMYRTITSSRLVIYFIENTVMKYVAFIDEECF